MKDKDTLGISVIIPTYNRARMLGITLESFLQQQYPQHSYEIIVSDNNSSDNTKDVIQSFVERSSIHIVYHFEPRQGVHYARNSAIKIARFDLLYFTDDDMIADKILLREIVKPFILDPAVGAATGSVLPHWEVAPPKWVLKHCVNGWLSLLQLPDDLTISRDSSKIYSCHEAVLKEALIKAGGFYPENTAGCWIGDGETGTNRKIGELGYKFGYIASSIIYHIIPQGRMTQKYLNKRFSNQARCNAYSNNRHDPTYIGVINRVLVRNLLTMPKVLIEHMLQIIKKRDISYGRLILAYCHYFKRWTMCDILFLLNKNYREMVLQEHYLHDSEPS
jgi:glucosyl-dolichyl phosphate glucuronosyltransferase